jgi:dipeptidyl aminopeptidase/acylaminoacyl peptidase
MESISSDRIDSWKDNSAYLGRDVSTVMRWEKEKKLPVHRIPGGQRQGVFAYRHELNEWMVGRSDFTDGSEPFQTNGGLAAAATAEGLQTQAKLPTPVEPSQAAKVSHWKRALYSAVGFLAALVVISAYEHVSSWFTFGTPQLLGQRQLTNNGREKRGLLTDGRTVYFGQEQNGWFALAEMPAVGGPIRVLWNPPANVLPIDVSPDGKQLLASSSLGVEIERELWVVPLDRGEPRRLSNIKAHSAAWAPDGKTIAYAAGTGVYLTSPDGIAPKEICLFASVPRALNWSSDGRGLRFVLEGFPSGKNRLWGELSGSGMSTITMHPLPAPVEWDGAWISVRRTDTAFVLEDPPNLEQTSLWLVRFGRGWWEPSIYIAPVPSLHGDLDGIAFEPELSRVLVLTKPQERATFVRYDLNLQTFRQILPGISGIYLNYSRDGEWIAYVGSQDGSLRVSRADGSGARQLTYAPDVIELPRWSPDGKQIAYMTKRPGRPWRIYVLQLESGKAREASGGDDGQGAPTWSPDGRFISYGNVECEGTHSCAIHRIDLASGKVHTLPDSDGLFTARWSPDGRFIAALHLEQHQLMLFDAKGEKWHKLADGINGNDLDWSPDSKYLFVDFPGEARIARFHTADGRQDTVLDLRSQDDFNLAETDDLQFSVAPDNAVILHRQIHSQEIFAYDEREH